MDLKKILIIIVIILAVAELFILTSSEPEPKTPLPIPVTEKPAQPIAVTKAKTVSYPAIYEQETIDAFWSKATELQIASTAEKQSKNFSSYFNKISTACKSTICKIEVATENSNQPFPIMVADFVNAMKGQGWLADVSVLTEDVTANTTSGRAVIYLINPTR